MMRRVLCTLSWIVLATADGTVWTNEDGAAVAEDCVWTDQCSQYTYTSDSYALRTGGVLGRWT